MSDATNTGKEKTARSRRYDGAVMERRETKKEVVCPFCGVTMAEYLRTGLLGCAACYSTFGQEIMPYVIRLHGSGEHGGKEISRDGKYEAAQSLRAASKERERAVKSGDFAVAKKMERKEAELKWILFGDDEEE